MTIISLVVSIKLAAEGQHKNRLKNRQQLQQEPRNALQQPSNLQPQSIGRMGKELIGKQSKHDSVQFNYPPSPFSYVQIPTRTDQVLVLSFKLIFLCTNPTRTHQVNFPVLQVFFPVLQNDLAPIISK